MSTIRVAELFAGVGGFRIGFEAANKQLQQRKFEVVWSNQWEPSTKVQHASDVYVREFGPEGHSNVDIATVEASDIPDFDMLVGGFPCQDYSVATTLKRSGGLEGKKGVLWWEIHRILRDKAPKPKYLFLENVDRLLKSPSNQRGRDFAVMLASLSDLGYAVEWRVINAADYGMPQRRRRVFILGYLKGTAEYEAIEADQGTSAWLTNTGTLARAFPIADTGAMFAPSKQLAGSLAELSEEFNATGKEPPFADCGYMVDRHFTTFSVRPSYSGPRVTLGDILVAEQDVPEEFFINEKLDEWIYLKGSKTINRVSRATGHSYQYSEGGIAFPDHLDKPSRTVITGEGGVAPSRFKHIVLTPSGRYRRLVPVELERLNMFPDNHTAGVPDSRRAFLMGNALVTGIVATVAKSFGAHAEVDVARGARLVGRVQELMNDHLSQSVPALSAD